MKISGTRLAIRHDNHVFDLCRRIVQHVLPRDHAKIHIGPTIGAEGIDRSLNRIRLRSGAQLRNDLRLPIKSDHSNLIPCTQQFNRGLGRLAREFNR